ncbi:palmitoyltransferase ZDHHC21 isoform X2 [Pan paniscus]|uniref:palmitoyltransferase ZDHHC21 isoform X2 n=1 Tax=Pan paniscus TaxID=9597 RepID=UPI002436B116|nr:palmitoyltransferase ZDHHC21 isoform X2 [Pan paniscus]
MGLRIHFVVDPHGWCCMGLIVFVWLYNIVLIPKIVLFPHYEEGHIPGILIIIFYGISIFCLVALVRASITDPGRLPENPKIPHGEREFWELCNKCNLMRPKRSHHCSRCGHCVRRMDHHCPWINNCVGEDNHWLFLQLCFYTELLTCYALMFSFCHYYYFLPLKKRNLDLFVFRHELAIMRLAAFMGITMLVGITGLFYTQLIGIITMLFHCQGLPPHIFLENTCSPLWTIQLSLPGGTLSQKISFSMFCRDTTYPASTIA